MVARRRSTAPQLGDRVSDLPALGQEGDLLGGDRRARSVGAVGEGPGSIEGFRWIEGVGALAPEGLALFSRPSALLIQLSLQGGGDEGCQDHCAQGPNHGKRYV